MAADGRIRPGLGAHRSAGDLLVEIVFNKPAKVIRLTCA
jgi:hypothetical protein